MIISVSAIAQNKKKQIIDVHFHARYFREYGTPPPANHIPGKVSAYKSNVDVINIMIKTLKANAIVKAIASVKLDRVADLNGR